MYYFSREKSIKRLVEYEVQLENNNMYIISPPQYLLNIATWFADA